MPIIAAAGGTVISRGRPTETVVADGGEDGHPDLVAIMRFSSATAIRTFLSSAEYQAYVGDRESAFEQLHSYIADDLIAG